MPRSRQRESCRRPERRLHALKLTLAANLSRINLDTAPAARRFAAADLTAPRSWRKFGSSSPARHLLAAQSSTTKRVITLSAMTTSRVATTATLAEHETSLSGARWASDPGVDGQGVGAGFRAAQWNEAEEGQIGGETLWPKELRVQEPPYVAGANVSCPPSCR
jgi:hypothetical protein